MIDTRYPEYILAKVETVGMLKKCMVVNCTKMGAADKPVFGLTRVCKCLSKPFTGNPRRLGLSVAPGLFLNIYLFRYPHSPKGCPLFLRSFNSVFTAAAAFLLLCIFPIPAYASDTGNIDLSGSISSLTSIIDDNLFDTSDQLLFMNVLRLIADIKPSDRVSCEIHLVQDLTLSTADSPLGAALGGMPVASDRYRAFDLSGNTINWNNITGGCSLDRLNAKFRLPHADITIGRQAITFGKAYFWNPLDIFLPFNAQQIERDYKAGVDAVRVDIPLGNFSGINIVGALGREIGYDGAYINGNKSFDADWYASSLLARYFTTLKGWDYAIQGGKVYGGYQLGGGFVGEVNKYQLRGEAAYLSAKDSPELPAPFTGSGDLIKDNLVAVIGGGRLFPNTLDIEVEYLYNGAADPHNPDISLIRLLNGATLHLGRHIAGATATYQFTPLLTGQFVCIHSFSDSSTQIRPVVTYSAGENIDFQLGAIFNFGAHPNVDLHNSTFLNSEFGSLPGFYFIEYKAWF